MSAAILAGNLPQAPAAAAAGYAFVLGLVGVANPCGLPLLPAYLSFFTGHSGSRLGRAARSVGASACVTAGFVLCFAVIGLALGGAIAAVESAVPAVMIVAGVTIFGLGVLIVTGRHLPVRQLRRGAAVRDRGPVTMVSFGLFYALASLGCSLPVFLAAVGGSLDRAGIWAVLRSCVAYALGMGVLLAVIALAGTTVTNGAARVLRVSGRLGQPVAGALLVVSGAYLAYYWAVSLSGPATTPRLISAVNAAQASIAGWLTANGRWLGLLCGVVVIAVIASFAIAGDRSRGQQAAGGPVDDGDHTPLGPATRGARSEQSAGGFHLQEQP